MCNPMTNVGAEPVFVSLLLFSLHSTGETCESIFSANLFNQNFKDTIFLMSLMGVTTEYRATHFHIIE